MWNIRKRGISPLIATVLIIGFTVALAAVIMTWGKGFTESMTKGAEEGANQDIVCTRDVKVTIPSVCYIDGDTQLKMVINNDKQQKIEAITARIKESPDKVAVNASSVDTVVKNVGVGSLAPFASSSFVMNAADLSGTLITPSKVKSVELILVVKIGERLVTCAQAQTTYGSATTSDTIPKCTV